MSIKERDYYTKLGRDLLEKEYRRMVEELNSLKNSLLEQLRIELERETRRVVSALQNKFRTWSKP
uniref:Uncharacterized protein n=1 Tax=Fervidicoccus fontis TaxID=683846 RepID=A0A7J3ZKM8_9CREN